MKVRGTLTVTKNLIIPAPNGTVAKEGLIAVSDINGSLSWKRLIIAEVVNTETYAKGSLVMDGENMYFAKADDAPGTTPLNTEYWTELAEGGAGITLTQDQLDAITNSKSPSAGNPFATVGDLNNLTLVGTDTIENILAAEPQPANQLWVTSNDGVDSNGGAVVAGDGLVSDGALWTGVGPIRGPIGLEGPSGAGTLIVGSDTVTTILGKDAASSLNEMWIATTSGLDSSGATVAAGDGVASNGTQWLTVGQVRGEKGEQGYRGENGKTAQDGTYMITGGIEWLYGYTYRLTASKYAIAGLLYSAAPTIITLIPGLFSRYDAFVVNTSGLFYTYKGSEGGEVPAVNESYELSISFVNVITGTSEDPAMTRGVIYEENIEWATSIESLAGATINLEHEEGVAPSGPDDPSGKSIQVLNGREVVISFTTGAPVSISSELSVLTFRMKSLFATSNANVSIWLYNDDNKVGTALSVEDYGYDYTNTSDWQYITMYIGAFKVFAPQINKIKLIITDPTYSKRSDFLVDNIRYQWGLYVKPVLGQVIDRTSQLINDGEGVGPFITAAGILIPLQQITDEGNTTTNDIIVGDAVNTNITIGTQEISVVSPDDNTLTVSADHGEDVNILFPKKSGRLGLHDTVIHTQGSSSDLWTVAHNMGKYPSVTVVNTSKSTIEALVTYADENNLVISVTPASAGYAYMN